jgi:D-alanyl-lipoteichoic acid acyltransferase DltB (MBOAT superfamily)
MGAVFFSFQIYCDFSGYSDMAIGLARMLGFHTAENFNYPYYSRSIGEFWSRWHISLSLWLRDYLFLPLAYGYMRRMEKLGRLPIKLESQAYLFSTLLTMLLAGLWHGANWTFVVWGGMIGLLLILSFLTRKVRRRIVKKIISRKMKPSADGIRIIFTFSLVSLAWIFFRAATIPDALAYISRISLTPETKGMGHIIFLSLLILLFLLADHFVKTFTPESWIARVPLTVRTAGYALALCFLIILGVDHANEFLYFSF